MTTTEEQMETLEKQIGQKEAERNEIDLEIEELKRQHRDLGRSLVRQKREELRRLEERVGVAEKTSKTPSKGKQARTQGKRSPSLNEATLDAIWADKQGGMSNADIARKYLADSTVSQKSKESRISRVISALRKKHASAPVKQATRVLPKKATKRNPNKRVNGHSIAV